MISSPGVTLHVSTVGSPYSRGCWHDVGPPKQLRRQVITSPSGLAFHGLERPAGVGWEQRFTGSPLF